MTSMTEGLDVVLVVDAYTAASVQGGFASMPYLMLRSGSLRVCLTLARVQSLVDIDHDVVAGAGVVVQAAQEWLRQLQQLATANEVSAERYPTEES